jgi:hypothetical protein
LDANTSLSVLDTGLSALAFTLTVVNGWLVFVLKGLQAQLNEIREDHKELREKQANHETKVAERTLTREEFKQELNAQTLQLTTLMNHAIRNIK